MSGTLLSEDAIVRGLVAQGVPREKAEREARQLLRRDALYGRSPRIPGGESVLLLDGEPVPIPPAPAIAWPVQLLLPWSFLVSDNDKTRARLITRNGAPMAINVITTEYAKAMEKIANVARSKIGDAAAVAEPLGIHGLVFVPDERPHDVANFCKLVHDALEGVIYLNDRWLHDVHWTRAGVDVDAPRAEVSLAPVR